MIRVRNFHAELITAVVLLLVIAGLFIQTFSFAPSAIRGYPGAAFFPRLTLIGGGAFTLIWIFMIVRRRTDIQAKESSGEFVFELPDYIITCAAVIAYVILLGIVGFEISTFALLAVLLFPRIGAVASVLAAFVTTLVLYGTFVLLLNVSVPLLFLPSYLRF